jgi:amidophosphoribosyltransferase
LQKSTGLVTAAFTEQKLAPMKGFFSIGHTRYSTTGSSVARNAQPFLVETRYGPLAVSHNGNLTNAGELRDNLLQRGIGLASSSDSEVMILMLAGADGATWEERISNTMARWEGAFSLTVLTRNNVYAVRDRWGYRPLSVGQLSGGGHAAASETGALNTIGCRCVREVEPGEIIALGHPALRVIQAVPPADELARCVFEHVYFSRPDSFWDGMSVHAVRQRLGKELAREASVVADLVIAVPDSGVPAAIGYSRASGIEFNDGFIKNRYIGRTFIEPTPSLRRQGVALKFNVLGENLRGKRIVVIDDSIVRGTTAGPLVKMLRDAGAAEVHVRITCPPIRHPCFMGVDMGTCEELIAYRMSVEEIRAHIGANSLSFLSLEGMMRAVGRERGYCHACFSGEYQFEVMPRARKDEFEVAIV